MSLSNPFFAHYTTSYNVPPFECIEPVHFLPALKEAFAIHFAELEVIISNPENPTFSNTIEALDHAGSRIAEVSLVFSALKSAHGTEGIMAISDEMSKLLSHHRDTINFNPALFERIKVVYDNKDSLDLSTEQMMLLTKRYTHFTRNGINTSVATQDQLRIINARLGELTNQFNKNLMAETNGYQLIVSNKDELIGLSDTALQAAAQKARDLGLADVWVFTPHKPSILPVLQQAQNRKLRQTLYEAYYKRGNNNNEFDNKMVVTEMTRLRMKKANLLGYPHYAAYVLEERMATSVDEVNTFLMDLWDKALPVAKKERETMQLLMSEEGNGLNLEAWDWLYYAEKVRQKKYEVDENELRPYFQLPNVVQGAFDVANKLYGLTFKEAENSFPKPHSEAQAYIVSAADGSHQGVLYTDWYPRTTKNPGAWCGVYRKQSKRGGAHVPPVVTVVGNLSKPNGVLPALLSFDEVNTIFHEFGHALHQLLSNTLYYDLSGTSVPRDFVELPSQIMENWASHPQVIQDYALHYQTGQRIPTELVNKLLESRRFNQGYETVEYLAASLLDMQYHMQTSDFDGDVDLFEDTYFKHIGLIDEINTRYKSTFFKHIFGGNYMAGYYSYIWAGVLDADAFDAFLETDLFDPTTATSFRKHILERGGSDDAMTMYSRFRGRKPTIHALLKQRGLM